MYPRLSSNMASLKCHEIRSKPFMLNYFPWYFEQFICLGVGPAHYQYISKTLGTQHVLCA